ncbi:hypothetical protein R1sor_013078 [Riccia sorocarpa]|uniref:Protein unc-45 homolog B n=1 Tax=Riccia sorocarpa TaxID=122646 RepID=A0ABD3H9E6_9MARC
MDDKAAPRRVVQANTNSGYESEKVLGVAYSGKFESNSKYEAESKHLFRRLVRRLGNSSRWLVDQCLCSCLIRDKLRGIVSELFQDDHPEVQLQGAKSLLKLTNAEQDQDEKLDKVRIAEYPRLLTGLVRILRERRENPYLQRHAALTLYILSLVQENALKIAKFPGALEALAKLLFVDENSKDPEESIKLQADALSALAVISVVPEAGRMIMGTAGALKGCVRMLSDYDRPDVVDEVCKTFSRLSDGQENAEMLAESPQFPHALEGLVNLIAMTRNQGNYDLLKSAILSLYNLSATEEIQVKIANYPKLLDELVMCLWNEYDNLLVEHAASTVGKLTMPQEKQALMSCPEVLPALVEILFKDMNPDAQEEAVWALANLSHDEEANRKIAELPGAVDALVRLLSKDDSPSRQEQAARALANLTCLPENDRYILMSDETSKDLLKCIVGLLSYRKKKHNAGDIHMWAMKGLQNLAATFHQESWIPRSSTCAELLSSLLFEHSDRSGPDSIEIMVVSTRGLGNLAIPKDNKLSFCQCEKALVGLLELLQKHGFPEVQREAAWALKNLFRCEENDEGVTAAEVKGPQAIPYLMVLLSDDVEFSVLQEVTTALAYISRFSGNRSDIIEFPGALKRMVAVLSKGNKPSVQIEALKIVFNLTRTQEYRARVADSSELFHMIMSFLCKSGIPKLVDLQRGATMIASNLALESTYIERIVKYPDAIEGIGDLLYHYDDISCLESAAKFFQNISSSVDPKDHHLKLSEFPRVLAGLELLLCADDPPVLMQSLLTLLNLTVSEENQRTVSESKSALLHLNRLLTKEENSDAQLLAAMVLQNLSRAESNVPNILAQCYYVFEGLLGLLAYDGTLMQEVAIETLVNLAKIPDYQLKIAEYSNTFESVGKLCMSDNEVVVEQAASLLGSLAAVQENRMLMAEVPEIIKGLDWLLSDRGMDSNSEAYEEALQAKNNKRMDANIAELERISGGSLTPEAIERMLHGSAGNAEMSAIKALAYIDPNKAVQCELQSGEAFATRGIVLLEMEMYEEAVADLEDAMCLLPGQHDADFTSMSRWAKWKLEDYEGALDEANRAIELNPQAAWQWQERGVLKRYIGDLDGALEDLDRALELESDVYEVLKQRGYVKFLMEDDDGAREDAERALTIRATTAVHVPEEGELVPCLGILPVEYLEFKL